MSDDLLEKLRGKTLVSTNLTIPGLARLLAYIDSIEKNEKLRAIFSAPEDVVIGYIPDLKKTPEYNIDEREINLKSLTDYLSKEDKEFVIDGIHIKTFRDVLENAPYILEQLEKQNYLSRKAKDKLLTKKKEVLEEILRNVTIGRVFPEVETALFEETANELSRYGIEGKIVKYDPLNRKLLGSLITIICGYSPLPCDERRMIGPIFYVLGTEGLTKQVLTLSDVRYLKKILKNKVDGSTNVIGDLGLIAGYIERNKDDFEEVIVDLPDYEPRDAIVQKAFEFYQEYLKTELGIDVVKTPKLPLGNSLKAYKMLEKLGYIR